MMMRVKVCGMATVEDVRTCVDAGVDAIGFIFAQSPRRLALGNGQAGAIAAAAPPFVTRVGVFANDSEDVVRTAIAQCRLDVLQFSGDEEPAFCGSFGKPTVLSVRDRTFSQDDLDAASAVALIVDSFGPGRYGGTGRTVEAGAFERARAAHPNIPLVLAGGLTPANVGWIAGSLRPYAVDVRSGVEREGRKDPELVLSFVKAARAALA